MQHGKTGFWEGVFADGARFVTELPNIAALVSETPLAIPKPKASRKKGKSKAKAGSKALAKAKAKASAKGKGKARAKSGGDLVGPA
eukprot:611811-Alexandrium_andersonii.AAC.1